MRAIDQIRQKIEAEVFDYTQLMHELREYKKPRDVISSLLKTGNIIRIRKGLYLFGKSWQRKPVIPKALANLVYGPSVISLDYALAYYGLIPERVDTITSITTSRTRMYDTPVGRFSYEHLSEKRFAFGATIQHSDYGNWLIAEPLKSLADKVWTDKRLRPTSLSSFQEYIFNDLRIDEDVLRGHLAMNKINDLEKIYSSRKVTWLAEFLKRKFFE